MNLTLDIGNTAVKWAAFEGRTLVEQGYDLPTDKLTEAEAVLVSTVLFQQQLVVFP